MLNAKYGENNEARVFCFFYLECVTGIPMEMLFKIALFLISLIHFEIS